MRWLTWLLVVLFVLLQYKLWVGDGSLAEVWDLYRQTELQKQENQRLQERNQALEAEVKDLKQGLEAIEERAREELGIEVTRCATFMNLRHEYDDRIVTIEFFIVSDWVSEPVGREGQALRWVPREKLDANELLPADVPVVEALQQQH